jgi:hypothetical protein
LLAFSLLTLPAAAGAQAPATSGTTPFVLSGNRVYAELSFVRPDGSIHKALAFVDMGSPAMTIAEPLFKELRLDRKRPLTFRLGTMTVRIPAAEVTSDPDEPRALGPDRMVEAMLPAGVLRQYQVVLDYQHRTLTIAKPGALKPEGIGVPFRMNGKTGLIAVDASIDGKPYAITIDNGSAYTWLRQSVAEPWLGAHPGWVRGVGAVGASNMMMSGDGAEASGIMLHIPEIKVGPVSLADVGALGAGPGRGFGGTLTLFDWYSTKNAVPVIGWIGGNVLKGFRLTVDYPNHTLYWLKQADADAHDLDQVGLTLQSQHGEYLVAAIATKNGQPTVAGVQAGDILRQVDELALKGATWGAIYAAMHGTPGDVRTLRLERQGRPIVVKASVTAF